MNGKQLKNSILQWAIQGKLVPQDPNDEPASVLLERIRAEKARLVKEKKIKKDKNESIIYRSEDNSYYEKFLATGEVKCIDEEIPFEIPQGWEWARINTIGISQLGKMLDRGKNIGQEYPYLCSINVYWDGIDLSKIKTFKLRDDELSKYRLHKGDLLICEGGDYGRCCVWDRDEEMYYQNALHRIRFYCGLFPIFYKFVFELYRNIGYIVGQGQTIKHFTYESMKSIVFPVPSISEQKRIVELLKEVLFLVKRYDKKQDALNYLNERINVKLQKSILQEAIQGKLVPQDSTEESASMLLERIRKEKQKLATEGKLKKSALTDSIIYKGDDNKYYERIDRQIIEIELPFEYPSSWAVLRLKDVCQLIDGEKRSEKGICLDAKYLRGKSSATIVEKGKFVYAGDNIILVDGENSGEVFAVPQDGYMGSTFKQLWLSSVMWKPYVLAFILFYKEELRNSKRGAAIPHLNKELFYNLPIGIPPLAEQKRIVERINELSQLLK
ncbi:restriction endonuclease subunit S [Bacteroides caccae]|uniref:restriction endonuclease subunit S n=1 Tax=Bacteroides caccae TaxID=47678 RepID=UPI000ED6066B|nr:restriction endonuclease subunit S [Bacteroides caccae]RGN41176.1 restriction endonuclease subunit S [Bacteroides caccae]